MFCLNFGLPIGGKLNSNPCLRFTALTKHYLLFLFPFMVLFVCFFCLLLGVGLDQGCPIRWAHPWLWFFIFVCEVCHGCSTMFWMKLGWIKREHLVTNVVVDKLTHQKVSCVWMNITYRRDGCMFSTNLPKTPVKVWRNRFIPVPTVLLCVEHIYLMYQQYKPCTILF